MIFNAYAGSTCMFLFYGCMILIIVICSAVTLKIFCVNDRSFLISMCDVSYLFLSLVKICALVVQLAAMFV